MRRNPLKIMSGAIATAAVALMLIGCRGATGQNGANGTNGTNGNNGGNGTNGTAPAINAAQLTPAEWGQLTLKGAITSVTTGGAPVVNFSLANSLGTPIKGMGFSQQNSTAKYPSYPSFGFTIAKLVPSINGSPSHWVDYIVLTAPKTADAAPIPRLASYENYGTLDDHGDGTYTYHFRWDITQVKSIVDGLTYAAPKSRADLGDVSYEPTLTHRVGIFIGGNAFGTGTVTPNASNSGIPAVHIKTSLNLVYDFIPATGQAIGPNDERRDLTTMDTCNQCHAKLAFHGSNRVDPRFCVTCHTDQLKYGFDEATKDGNGNYTGTQGKINGFAAGNFPNFIHRIHKGDELSKTGYNIFGLTMDATFPQDHRNCVKCHSGSTSTPQGDNWFNKPNRLACGACHDSIDWNSGQNHGPENLPALNDQNCTQCHSGADIKTYHIPAVAPNPGYVPGSHTNGSTVSAFTNHLPDGANVVTWDLKSVTLNASAKPVFTFRIMKNGTPVVFNTADKPELMPNYIGGPAVYLAFGVPQDGIQTPADWNATVSGNMRNIWNGTATGTGAGTFAGPDSSGYYTITLTGVTIPTTAGHMTGGIGYSYSYSTPPLTQIDLAAYPYSAPTKIGGLSVPAPNVWKTMSGTMPAGFGPQVARRAIVSNAKCLDCHGKLGVFTQSVFHAGERNDGPTCSFCHNVNRVNSGWGVNIKDAVHAIHGPSKRENKFSWEAGAGDKYWEIMYPGILNNCEACHVPGSYDFGASANSAEVPNLLWTTVATGTVPNPVNVVVTGNEPIPGTYWSPFVTAGAVYGSGFSVNAGTGVITPAAPTTLVSSPYVSACSSCHDSSLAIAHMTNNGGAFYEPRSTAFSKVEQCFLCHSSGKVADTKAVHMTF